MAKITDGTGSGVEAHVTIENKLATESVTITEAAHSSEKYGKCYQWHFERSLASASTFETVGHLEYTGESKLHVEAIMFSKEDADLAGTGQAVFELMAFTDYTSGGDITTPINMNLSSTNQPTSTAYTGSTTIVTDTTNEKEIMDFSVINSHMHRFDGALILGKGDRIEIIGKSGDIGDILHAQIFAYEFEEK
jgi:hypothetical protein